MRSLFKRKNNNNTDTSHDNDQYHGDVSKERLPTPPMGPIDPDGSTASHSSNDMYIDIIILHSVNQVSIIKRRIIP